MRSYIIEDLRKEDIERIKQRLDAMELGGLMDDLHWFPLPPALLNPEQQEHKECGPHCMALEVGDTWLKLELLVRARNILRCSCVSYATSEQRAHMMDYLDTLLKELDISV